MRALVRGADIPLIRAGQITSTIIHVDNHPMGATAMAELMDSRGPPKKRGVAKPKKVAAKQPAKVAKKAS